MISNLGEECWKYYLHDCLPSDEIILEKLTDSNIAARWNELVAEYGLYKIELNHKEIIKLVQSGAKDKTAQVTTLARGLLTKLTMK